MSSWHNDKKKPFNVRVEYDPAPIRHCAVQCPECNKWFYGDDALEDGGLTYDYELRYATFRCPVCHTQFGYGTEYDKEQIIEMDHPEIYEGCLQKKVTWE